MEVKLYGRCGIFASSSTLETEIDSYIIREKVGTANSAYEVYCTDLPRRRSMRQLS